MLPFYLEIIFIILLKGFILLKGLIELKGEVLILLG